MLQAKDRLLKSTGGREDDIAGERIAFLAENSYDYVGTVSLRLNYSLTTLLTVQ